MKQKFLYARMLLLPMLALCICAHALFAQREQMSPALASLVKAERSFAQTSVERGVRESFLAFFADDGMNFQPHPTKTKEAILKRPAPATRPTVTLNWEPVYADVSQSGELGYTTGPYTLTDNSSQAQPVQYGYYFSVWKKQADGNWKVIIDCGIKTPAPLSNVRPITFQAAPASQFKAIHNNQEAGRMALINADQEFLKAAQTNDVTGAYLKFLADGARLHRNGALPFIGKDAIRVYLDSKKMVMTWQPLKSDISQSGELGYTYGSYQLRDASTPTVTTEQGYYVRVWKRRNDGKWKVVLETTSPIPANEK